MFNLIDRYIARQVISASLLILFLLASLSSLFGLLNELTSLGKGSYQFSDALLYTGLTLPSKLIEFFPMSVLIGALFALGAMASSSELTVMRASGMTTWRIAGSSLKASLILMLVLVLVGEGVAPRATKAAQQLRTAAISGGELSFSQTGLWAKRNNEIIQIGRLLNDGQLRDLTIYQLSLKSRLNRIIQAQQAYQNGTDWVLQGVVETRFYSDKIETTKSPSKIWLQPLAHSQIETLTLEPETLNIAGLLDYIEYLSANALESKPFELALWRKILQPLAIAVMMFLAASFVFGPMRNASMGGRILSGVLLGFVFHLANQSFGPVSLVFNTWPLIGAALPLFIFAGAAWQLMKKAG